VQWHDLAFFATDKYEYFRKMITEPDTWIWEDINDTWCVDLKGHGGEHVYEVVPGGAAKKLTAANVGAFVEAAATAIMVTSVARALDAMRAGFEDVFAVPECALPSIITAEDFQIVLNGSPDIDVEVLKSHTQVSGGSDEFTARFWAVVAAMSPRRRSELLGFWTGSACVPSDLSGWTIKLEVGSDSAKLPSTATCYKKMRIPAYATADELAAKLGRAILEETYQQA
jgi:hypothetical protein